MDAVGEATPAVPSQDGETTTTHQSPRAQPAEGSYLHRNIEWYCEDKDVWIKVCALSRLARTWYVVFSCLVRIGLRE